MKKIFLCLLAALTLVLLSADLHAQGHFASINGHNNEARMIPIVPLAEEAVALPLLLLSTGGRGWPIFLSVQPAAVPGTLSGSATRGMGPAFFPISGASAVLRNPAGVVVATTATDALGQFSIPNLDRGNYNLRLTTPAGLTAGEDIAIAEGVESRALFFLDGRTNAFFAFKPAVAIGADDPQIDVTGDGKVNLDDLVYVEFCVGKDPMEVPACGVADLNGDGMIDATDLDLIRGNFDRFVLGVPGLYGAPVSRGGSRALIAGDFPLTSNAGGLTEVMADMDPTNPRQVLFQVMSDRGSASPPPPLMGDLVFTENADDLTSGTLNLDTGRFTGRMTLRVSLPPGMEDAPMEGNFAAGQIVFAPQGFNLYHAFVTGNLPPDFPAFAGAAFTMSKCEPNKPNVPCDPENVVGSPNPDPRCAGGIQCKVPGAPCVLNGKQGTTCQTVVADPRTLTCACVCK